MKYISSLLLSLLIAGAAQAESIRAEQTVRLYHPNYWIFDGNGDVKFQVSVAYKLLAFSDMNELAPDLWMSYTGLSKWALTSKQSSPFEETNYSPAQWLAWGTGGDQFVSELKLGNLHQSNGEPDPTSRAWDRLFAEVTFRAGPLSLYLTPWYVYRIESRSNPDIRKYLGDGAATVTYTGESFHGACEVRYSEQLNTISAFQIDYARKLLWTWHRFYVYAQYFEGYGEFMIDYNKRSSGLLVGLLIEE